MRRHSSSPPGWRAQEWCIKAPAALALLLTIFAASSADAQQRPAGQPLRQQVESRFEVLPLSEGLLLRPKGEMGGVRSIEVNDGELAVDGRDVEPEDLERRIGSAAAAPVRALLALDDDELRELFAFDEPEAEPTPAEAAPGIPLPPVPPLPPGVPDDVRERIEDAIEDQHGRIEREQEELQERLQDELEERSEEMSDREAELQRELERVHRVGRGQDARVVVGTPVRVPKGETTGDVVALGGGVSVDGEVSGDAVSIGGPARIRGLVTGSVVSVGGGVRLGSDARVMGDVVSVGGALVREPGAEVHGEVTEVSLWQGLAGGWATGWGAGNWDFGPFAERHDYFEGALGKLMRTSISFLVLILVGVLVAAVARTPLERVSDRATTEPWKAGLVGLLSIVLFAPLLLTVVVLLAISIVGIPLLLLIPFAILACVFLAFFGYLGAAHALGRWSERRFGWRVPSTTKALVLGLFLLHLWSLSARIIDVVDSSHDFGGFLAVMLWLFWMLLQLLAVSIGIGAVVLGRRGGPAPVAVPPPAPQPPPPIGSAVIASGTSIAAAGSGVAATRASSLSATAPSEPERPAPATPPPAEPDSWADDRWEEEVRGSAADAEVSRFEESPADRGDWFEESTSGPAPPEGGPDEPDEPEPGERTRP